MNTKPSLLSGALIANELIKKQEEEIKELKAENENLKREVIFHAKAEVELEREFNRVAEKIEGEANGTKS